MLILKQGLNTLSSHVGGCVVATHPEAALQKTKNCSIGSPEPSKVLEVTEDKTGRLLMIITGKNDDNDNHEREDVPRDGSSGNLIKQMRAIDVDGGADECNQISQEYRMPAFYRVRWKGKICLAKNEVCSDEIVGCTHSQDA